jgi:hypothetical protein
MVLQPFLVQAIVLLAIPNIILIAINYIQINKSLLEWTCIELIVQE